MEPRLPPWVANSTERPTTVAVAAVKATMRASAALIVAGRLGAASRALGLAAFASTTHRYHEWQPQARMLWSLRACGPGAGCSR